MFRCSSPLADFVSRLLPALLLVLAAVGARETLAGPETPQRIVSLNLCTDYYLLALASPGQIAALTYFSQDPAYSLHPEAAKGYPVIRGEAEEVLLLNPDLVIAGRFSNGDTKALLRKHGYPVVELDPVSSFEDAIEQIERVGRAIGRPEQGHALAESLKDRIAQTRRTEDPRPVVVYYQKRGYSAGTGTLMNQIMKAAGLTNLLEKLGIEGVSQIPLEQIIAHKPDLLLHDHPNPSRIDVGSELLLHPVLARLYPPERRLYVPQQTILCGGPSIADAIEQLSAQAARYLSRQRGTAP